MAERRMFAKTIVDSDAFLDMPISARLLYYDLSMRADDDGFNNSPKKVMKLVGATQDDLHILIARKFIIPFENGVVVIKHWRVHNYIRKDSYKETPYKDEKALLELDENNAYVERENAEYLQFNPVKEVKPITDSRAKRLEEKKNSSLPYSFEYKIRREFVGHRCPICNCVMSYSNNLTKPTIQHNKPISLGGKHEIDNISVICNGCNSSIQNRKETEPYNTEEVKKIWECIGNVSGMLTQDRIGKDRIGKDNNNTPPAKHQYGTHKNVLLTDDEYKKLQERYPKDYADKINTLSDGLALKGYKYKSHYLAVIKWAETDNTQSAMKKSVQATQPEVSGLDMDMMDEAVRGYRPKYVHRDGKAV